MGRAKTEIEDGRQKHSDGNVLPGITAIGEITHDEFSHAIGNRGPTQNIADHYLVIMKSLANFLGDRRQIIADKVEGCVSDEGGLENLPAKFWIETGYFGIGQPWFWRRRLEPGEDS